MKNDLIAMSQAAIQKGYCNRVVGGRQLTGWSAFKIEKISKQDKAIVDTVCKVIHKLVRKLFKNFKVCFAKTYGAYGFYIPCSEYVSPRKRYPIVFVSIKTIKRNKNHWAKGTVFADTILYIIMHELGHAAQDLLGLKQEEKGAELFVRSYGEIVT